MIRKMPPISRLNRSRSTRSTAKFCSSTNTMAPMNGPMGCRIPPSTAMMRILMSQLVPTEPGETSPLYQTIRIPPTAAMRPATA